MDFHREYVDRQKYIAQFWNSGTQVHQGGKIVSAVLSVDGIPAIKKTLFPQANGLIVDFEITLFALLLSELDGDPVAQHVRDATTETATAAPLRTFCNETSAWPYLALVPSFRKGKKVVKNLCVGQIIGLLQFRQVPRHPRKQFPERACAWGIHKLHSAASRK
jgi:hypothetical protein